MESPFQNQFGNMPPTHSMIDNYRILRTLGSGYSGKVKLGQDVETGNQYALKLLSSKKDNIETLFNSLKKEFDMLKAINHPSIIKMFELRKGTYISRTKGTARDLYYAVLEYSPRGELFDVIFHTRGLDENVSRFYFVSLIKALSYLHQGNIAHRDLKPENILLDSYLQLKLVDFGFATNFNAHEFNKSQLGTEKYMAPELVYNRNYVASQVDIFAAGIILFVLHSGHPPFNKAADTDPYYRALVKTPDRFWDFHSKQNKCRKYSPAFRTLINGMLAFQPTKRYTIDDVMNSEWVNQPVDQASALEQMELFIAEMAQIKQQEAMFDMGGNRDEDGPSPLEVLQEMDLADLPFEKLEPVESKQAVPGMIIGSESKQNLSALVLQKAMAMGFTREGVKKNKLVMVCEHKDHGRVEIEIRFFEIGESQFQVQVTRRSGDYLGFQELKSDLQKAVRNGCSPDAKEES